MNAFEQAVRSATDGMVRQYDYDDESIMIADFGHVDGDIDVIDDTAIIVINDEQYEFDVPPSASRGIMNNGIVTIEVEQ